MAKKEFVVKVKVERDGKDSTEEVYKSFDSLEKKAAELKKEINGMDFNDKNFKNLQKELKQVEGGLEKAKLKNQSFTDSLAGAPGIMGQVGQGIKGINTAFKAMLANPIVLLIAGIVAALTALYKAFTSTKAGAEKMEQIFAGVSATIDVLRDRFLAFAKALLSFDLKGIINAFKGIGEEIQNEAKAAMELKKELQGIDDAQRELNKKRALQNKQISEAKQKINDETLSYEQRLEALKQVGDAEKRMAEEEAELARRRYEAIKAQNALSDSSKESLDAEAAAYIEMQNRQKESADKQKEIADQQKALRDRQRAEWKARQQEREAALKSYNDLLKSLNLEQIEDEDEKARIILQNELEARQEQIKAMKIDQDKKNELLREAQESFDLKMKNQKKKEDEENEKEELDLLKRKLDASLQVLMGAEEKKYDEIKKALDEQMELELSNTELIEEEKQAIRQKYAKAKEDLDKENAQKTLENNRKIAQQEISIEMQRIAMKQWAVDQVLGLLDAESKAGKAALVVKQLLNAQELALDIKASLVRAKMALAESGVDVGKGFAKTLAAGFPQNVPLLIGYAAQAAGIVLSIKNAVKGLRDAASGGSGGSEGKGTQVRSFSTGGYVSGEGTSTSDSISARLSNGESVINARSTSMFAPLLSAINEAGGGVRFAGNSLSSVNSELLKSEMNSSHSSSEAPIIKTYVVSEEMTSSQQFERSIKSRSIL